MTVSVVCMTVSTFCATVPVVLAAIPAVMLLNLLILFVITQLTLQLQQDSQNQGLIPSLPVTSNSQSQ